MSIAPRGSFSRGTSVLAALVFVAILSSIAYAVHEISPADPAAQTAAVAGRLAADDGALDSFQSTGGTSAPSAAGQAEAEISKLRSRIDPNSDPRCVAPIKIQQDPNADVVIDASQQAANVCVPGCQYLVITANTGITEVSAFDTCKGKTGSELEACKRSDCQVRTCSLSSAGERTCASATSGPLASSALAAGARVESSVRIKADPGVQDAIRLAMQSPSDGANAYSGLAPYQQQAFKAAVPDAIASNLSAIERLSTQNPGSMTDAVDDLEAANRNLRLFTINPNIGANPVSPDFTPNPADMNQPNSTNQPGIRDGLAWLQENQGGRSGFTPLDENNPPSRTAPDLSGGCATYSACHDTIPDAKWNPLGLERKDGPPVAGTVPGTSPSVTRPMPVPPQITGIWDPCMGWYGEVGNGCTAKNTGPGPIVTAPMPQLGSTSLMTDAFGTPCSSPQADRSTCSLSDGPPSFDGLYDTSAVQPSSSDEKFAKISCPTPDDCRAMPANSSQREYLLARGFTCTAEAGANGPEEMCIRKGSAGLQAECTTQRCRAMPGAASDIEVLQSQGYDCPRNATGEVTMCTKTCTPTNGNVCIRGSQTPSPSSVDQNMSCPAGQTRQYTIGINGETSKCVPIPGYKAPPSGPPSPPSPAPQTPPGPGTATGGNVAQQDTYCLVSTNPVVSVPIKKGQTIPANCINRPGGTGANTGTSPWMQGLQGFMQGLVAGCGAQQQQQFNMPQQGAQPLYAQVNGQLVQVPTQQFAQQVQPFGAGAGCFANLLRQQPPAGNGVPQVPGTCPVTSTLCRNGVLYGRNSQCVDTMIRTCEFGCNGNTCAAAPANQCPPAPPQPAGGCNGTYAEVKTTLPSGTSCTTGWRCDAAKPTIVIIANPARVTAGETARLGWITTGMKSCTVVSSVATTASQAAKDGAALFTAQNAGNTSTNGTAQTQKIVEAATFALNCTQLDGAAKSASTVITPTAATSTPTN